MKPFAARVLCAVVISAFAAAAPLAARAEPRLYPTLAPFQFMVGSWQCKSWVAATTRSASRFDAVTARYSVLRGGAALAQRAVGPDYRSLELFGYEPTSRRIVTTALADDGSRALTSSAGWAGNAITLSGKYRHSGSNLDLRDILVKFTDRRFTDTTEIRQSGRWKTVSNSDCNKT